MQNRLDSNIDFEEQFSEYEAAYSEMEKIPSFPSFAAKFAGTSSLSVLMGALADPEIVELDALVMSKALSGEGVKKYAAVSSFYSRIKSQVIEAADALISHWKTRGTVNRAIYELLHSSNGDNRGLTRVATGVLNIIQPLLTEDSSIRNSIIEEFVRSVFQRLVVLVIDYVYEKNLGTDVLHDLMDAFVEMDQTRNNKYAIDILWKRILFYHKNGSSFPGAENDIYEPISEEFDVLANSKEYREMLLSDIRFWTEFNDIDAFTIERGRGTIRVCPLWNEVRDEWYYSSICGVQLQFDPSAQNEGLYFLQSDEGRFSLNYPDNLGTFDLLLDRNGDLIFSARSLPLNHFVDHEAYNRLRLLVLQGIHDQLGVKNELRRKTSSVDLLDEDLATIFAFQQEFRDRMQLRSEEEELAALEVALAELEREQAELASADALNDFVEDDGESALDDEETPFIYENDEEQICGDDEALDAKKTYKKRPSGGTGRWALRRMTYFFGKPLPKRGKGSHLIFETYNGRVPIPFHREIKMGTILGILKQSGLDPNIFFDM